MISSAVPSDPATAVPSGASAFQVLLEELHQRHRERRDGAVADYIPELARAHADGFGIALATADGRVYSVGDTEVPFTIQSISKPFVYGLALEQRSEAWMRRKVGVEPSGEAFNAISLDPDSGIPRNPMINAGAIATTAQVQQLAGHGAIDLLLDHFSGLAGRPLEIDQAVYVSERDTGHRNRAISHLLRNAGVIEEDPEPSLDLYFRQCAISVTCRDLALMAATLACQGVQPISGRRLLSRGTCTRMLALMGTCGMYDYAGHWLHDVGMPAKSGVAGGVLAVVPGLFGLAVWSPRLDRFGNSVRGIAVCEELSERLGLHLYDQNPAGHDPIHRSSNGEWMQSRRLRPARDLRQLNATGERLRVLQVQGVLDAGACEVLLTRLEETAAEADLLVLDLGRVVELQVSCRPLLRRQLAALEQAGTEVLLTPVDLLGADGGDDAGADGLAGLRWFESLDRALEAAEDLLLERPTSDQPRMDQVASGDGYGELVESLDPAVREVIQPLLHSRRFADGEVVIRRGERSDCLLIAREGLYETSLGLSPAGTAGPRTRLATFSPGMCFGEIGFLGDTPRTADIVCLGGGSCWELRRNDFEDLRRDNPEAACALLVAIAADIGIKLARASLQLCLLELG